MATETKPERVTVKRESAIGLSRQGLNPSGRVNWNLIAPELMNVATPLSDVVRSKTLLKVPAAVLDS